MRLTASPDVCRIVSSHRDLRIENSVTSQFRYDVHPLNAWNVRELELFFLLWIRNKRFVSIKVLYKYEYICVNKKYIICCTVVLKSGGV